MVRTYQVECLIHPDDTGMDATSVEDLEERANSDAVRSAVVAGQYSYATSAQTTTQMSTRSRQMTLTLTWIKRTNCGRSKQMPCWSSLPRPWVVYLVAAMGLGGGGVFMMLRKRKAVGGDMEAGQKSVARPSSKPIRRRQLLSRLCSSSKCLNQFHSPSSKPTAAPASQPIMQQQQQVPAAIFCAACGTRKVPSSAKSAAAHFEHRLHLNGDE